MKVLVLLSKIDQTGLTTNSLDLVDALVKMGHEVTVVVGKDKESKDEKLRHLHERLVNSGAAIIGFDADFGKNKITGALRKIKSTISVLRRIFFSDSDIIHVESPYMSFLPWLLGKKFVSTLHVNDLERRFQYKNATRLIAISKETKDYAIRVFDYHPGEIDIVLHGVSSRFANKSSEEEIIKLKEKLKIDQNSIVIGLVGSIEFRKGHDVLLKAVRLLPQAVLERTHIVFLGSYKSGSNGWLEDEIKSSGLEVRISWEEYQDSKLYYDLFDIFVLPSRLEGFPLVVLEAMLSECCVIRSNAEGASDQIVHGHTGFVFENENVDQLSQILQKLIENEEQIKIVGRAGKEFALKNFTNEIMAANTVSVYEKTIIE